MCVERVHKVFAAASLAFGTVDTASCTQLRQAKEKADALQADAERKHTEIMATINEQRSVLEGRIEQLKTFEREYRVRLKSYLESQLEELENRSSALPVDNGSDSFNQDNQSSGYSQSYAKGNN